MNTHYQTRHTNTRRSMSVYINGNYSEINVYATDIKGSDIEIIKESTMRFGIVSAVDAKTMDAQKSL